METFQLMFSDIITFSSTQNMYVHMYTLPRLCIQKFSRNSYHITEMCNVCSIPVLSRIRYGTYSTQFTFMWKTYKLIDHQNIIIIIAFLITIYPRLVFKFLVFSFSMFWSEIETHRTQMFITKT